MLAGFIAYALAVLFAAPLVLSWRAHPDAWAWALRAPYWAGPTVSFFAWATRRTLPSSSEWRLAQAVAAVLGWSAALDVAVGGLARRGVPWGVSQALSLATVAVVGGLVARARQT